MTTDRRYPIAALIAAGLLWGASVSLSKVALTWLDPAWLTLGRFLIAGLVLGFVARRRLREALRWQVLAGGAIGFGACVALQNVGIARTSVSHASVLMGVVPVLVALTSLLAGHGHASRREWLSYLLSLAGIGMVAAGGGGGASMSGDALVLLSVLLSAGLIAAQPRLLTGRDPAAVTAVQFFAAAGFALPLAVTGGHVPSAPASAGPVLAFAALTVCGTVLPFWLFAFGQAKVRPQLAGAFVNLEPVVGAAIGWTFFANPVGPVEILGAVAVIAGIMLAATCRTVPLSDLAIRLWRAGLASEQARLVRPWEREGSLSWRWRGGRWQLDGNVLPPDPWWVARDREPEPQA